MRRSTGCTPPPTQHGLGIVVDVVPNHVHVGAPQDLNPAWWGLLRDGPRRALRSTGSTWTGTPRTAGCWSRCSATTLEAVLDEIDARHAPAPSPCCDTTTTSSRSAPAPRDLPLAELLDAQHYRLASWRDPGLNYRRFFDVTTLAGIRVEERAVFDASHVVVADLVRSGLVDGLRIDHPDGLADPGGYLRDLAEATDGAWVVVEKIVEGDEELPADWPTAGTTGYETLTPSADCSSTPPARRRSPSSTPSSPA